MSIEKGIPMSKHYTIGQLAHEADVPTSTIRYYERRGLVRPDGRSAGNYRVYSEGTLEKLRFVRSAQAAGFTLGDISVLMELQETDAAPCQEVQDLISARLEQVTEQMKHLEIVDRVLRGWMKVCRKAERSGRCEVILGLKKPGSKKCDKVGDCP
jgi:DNA-binding transcriptional MerR regulator